jgi:hypothetical protein
MVPGLGKPARFKRAFASSVLPEVTIAHMSCGKTSNIRPAPSILSTPSVSATSRAVNCSSSFFCLEMRSNPSNRLDRPDAVLFDQHSVQIEQDGITFYLFFKTAQFFSGNTVRYERPF